MRGKWALLLVLLVLVFLGVWLGYRYYQSGGLGKSNLVTERRGGIEYVFGSELTGYTVEFDKGKMVDLLLEQGFGERRQSAE